MHTDVKPRDGEPPSRIDWEAGVYYELELQLDITTSDAQGIAMIHDGAMDAAFEEGLSPADTARKIGTLAIEAV
jgi:hypothetical protein